MSSVVIAGNTSGTITLDAPAVAGTTTLTLPATSGTVITTGSTFAGTGPAFSAFKTGSTQSISALTATKVTFPTESFDTNSNYDTSTSRFTPTVAGYYQITVEVEANGFTSNFFLAQIRKNGNQWMNGSNFPTTSAAGPCSIVTALVYCNGSTDYIEGFTIASSAFTIVGTTEELASKFQGFLARAA
jgi:hypothetical protein